MSNPWRDDRGLAAVELVIVAPVLVVILGGILQVGSLMQTIAIVRNAAREGARYAAVGASAPSPNPNPTNSTCPTASYSTGAQAYPLIYLQQALCGRGDISLNTATVTVCYPTPDPGCTGSGTPTVGQPVEVQVTLPIRVLGRQLNLASSATMKILQATS
jgi:Flp pilus assembly protein TadG